MPMPSTASHLEVLDRPLLERDSELARIGALVGSARRGKGAVAVVEGPAGIGKTRLVEAAIERARRDGLLVLTATGSEIESDFAFGVARQLFELPLSELASRERARVLSGVAVRAPVLLGVEHGDGRRATPESAFAASHSLFWLTANVAARKPLLLAVDDAHWADAPSLRYLHFLARRIADLPVAVVVATRPSDASAQGPPGAEPALAALIEQAGQPLQPSPLSGRAVADLVRAQLGREADPDFVEACERATNGNVFLLTELLRALRAGGVEPSSHAARAVLTVAPDAVRRRVAAQLAALPKSAGSLAAAIAVLGDSELPHAAAQAGMEIDEARRSARALERASLLAPGRPLRFLHPVIAAGVLAGISPGELADAHSRAARLLVAEGASTDAVAAHLRRSDPAGDPWTVTVLRRAAAEAIDRGAPEAAVAYLRRAAAEPPAPAARAELLLDLGKAETSAGLFFEATQSLRLGLAAAPDPGAGAALAIALSQVLDLRGDYDSSVEVLDEARRRLAEDAIEERAILDRQLVAQAVIDPAWRGAVDDRIRSWQAEARRGALQDPVAMALACSAALASGLAASVWLPLLRTATEDPRLRPYETDSDANSWAHNMAVMALEWSDCLEEADRDLTWALAESRRRGDAPMAASFMACKARVAFRFGRIADSESYCRLGQELSARIDVSSSFPFTLFDVLAEQGRCDEADELMPTVPALGGAENVAVVDLMRGRVSLAAGRYREALEDLLRAGEVLESLDFRHPNFVPWRTHAVEAAHNCGRPELAMQLAEENLAISRRTEVASAIGRALRVRSLVEPDRATRRALLEEACTVLAGSPARLDEAHCVVELGMRLRAEGLSSAREWLRRGLDLSFRCGATVLVERARRELVAAGGRPRRPVTSGIDALTPSERQVARMAAEGMTNREIAQALFVTLKTVEQHLGRTYDKLSISGRRALATALESAGSSA
jgi:DNA-binding CsgD family transcriptional regulator/tetratricopeptide (TPR) repeat protein